MFLFKRIWCKLTNQKLVALFDMDNTVTVVPAFTINDKLFAKRHWPWNIRFAKCMPNGTVENGSYVKRWEYV